MAYDGTAKWANICPKGVSLAYHRLNCNKSTGKYLRCYQVSGNQCMHCMNRAECLLKTEYTIQLFLSDSERASNQPTEGKEKTQNP